MSNEVMSAKSVSCCSSMKLSAATDDTADLEVLLAPAAVAVGFPLDELV